MDYNKTAGVPTMNYPTTGDPLLDWVLFVGVCLCAAWLLYQVPD
jgi:hypothetical protein